MSRALTDAKMREGALPRGKRVRVVIGVDQTGAVNADGGAKPLPAALAVRDARDAWRVVTHDADGKPLRLPRFDLAAFAALLAPWGRTPADALVFADVVFGFPAAAVPPVSRAAAVSHLWDWFARAARHHGPQGEAYGRAAAQSFFAGVWPGDKPAEARPQRIAEIRAGASSLFQTHPFQKNIQCGTHRIWRDLGREGAGPERVAIWPFSFLAPGDHAGLARVPWVFEAFPSMHWRHVLGSATRKPAALRALADAHGFLGRRLVWEGAGGRDLGPDAADAVVNALAGVFLWESAERASVLGGWPRRGPLAARLPVEGWIAGLPWESPAQADARAKKNDPDRVASAGKPASGHARELR